MKYLLLLVVSTAALGAPAKGPSVSPADALKELKAGNERFVSGQPAACTALPAKRGELVASQAPHTVVVSCSDSRVPPELVFDQTLGSLFVVRTAGNRAGGAEIASVEYALVHLGAKLIVVLGHESCGAIKEAVTIPGDRSAGSPALDELVGRIRIAVGPHKGSDLHPGVKRNVDAGADELVAQSEIVRSRVESGEAKIVRGVYNLASGKVEMWGDTTRSAAGESTR